MINTFAPVTDLMYLDYQRTGIKMHCTTTVEREWRAHACTKEPWTVAWIEKMAPGDVFLDAGANTGPYSLIAASRGLDVIAVEPGYANYARLCENILLNNYQSHVVPICAALGPETSLVWFGYNSTDPGQGNHKFGAEGGPVSFRTPMIALDDLVAGFKLPPPKHIKIDVDGAELYVLTGGQKLLASGQVRTLMIEIRKDAEAALYGVLQQMGWQRQDRYDMRHGQMMYEMHYALWTHPEPVVVT